MTEGKLNFRLKSEALQKDFNSLRGRIAQIISEASDEAAEFYADGAGEFCVFSYESFADRIISLIGTSRGEESIALERAIDHLGAEEIQPGRYAYDAAELPQQHIVSEADLIVLGKALIANDVYRLGETYHKWIKTVPSVKMPSWWEPDVQFAVKYYLAGYVAERCDSEKDAKSIAAAYEARGEAVKIVTASLETGDEMELLIL